MSAQRTLSRIGRYEPRKEIGRGTMGVVYEAWDPDLGRRVALKVVAPLFAAGGGEAYERRFLAEARAAARLSHRGIVVVHDVGRDAATGHVYIALEYLVGSTLQERLAGGPLPWPEALRIVAGVADALHHAHSNGIVHRDVKPANIMILASGEPKILDFGIARVDAAALTAPGEVFGTPLYMAPEQALGEPVDARSDIFSLGSVAYTALCGQPAFGGGGVATILARIAHREIAPPSEIVPAIPPHVDDCLARAMAKSPGDRYPDARAMAEDLQDILAGLVPRHRSGWMAPAPGERTLPSTGPPGAGLPELELVDVEPPRGRPSRARPYLFAALLASAAAYFYVYRSDMLFWRHELPKLAAAARAYAGSVALPPPQAAPAAASTNAAAPSPGSQAAAPAAPSLGAASAVPAAAVEPAPPADDRAPSPQPSPGAVAAGRRARPAVAYLIVDVANEARSGTLEVWVDGARVAREKLEGRVRRKSVSFASGKGGAPRALEVAAGRHDVEVRLRSEGGSTGGRTSGTFKAGATRRLEVTAGRRGPPALRWK